MANTATTNAATADQRAVTSGVYANSAFVAANTADQRAVTSGDYANSAYAVANTGGGTTANSASSYANGAFVAANTADQRAVTSGDYANSAFIRANNSLNVQSGGTITGDISVNGNISVTGCTATFTVNTFRTTDHIIDIGHGTTGTPTQNAGIRLLRGDLNPVQIRWVEVDDKWEFTNDGTNYLRFAADSAEVYANAAFAVANTGGGAGTDSYARDTANSAGVYANAAFAAANTGGGGGGGGSGSTEIVVDNFTGTGACTQFTLSAAPISENYITTVFDGVTQLRSTYSVSGTTITFLEAPPNTANIEITIIKNVTGTFINRNYIGNGSNTNFTVTDGVTANSVLVYQNGITQRPIDDYTVSGNTLTFLTAPTNGEIVQIRELAGDPGSVTVLAQAAFDKANTAATTGKSIAMAIVFGG